MSFWIGLIFGAVVGAGVAMVLMPRSDSLERAEGAVNSIELGNVTERSGNRVSTGGGDPSVKGGIYVRRES